MWEAHIIDTRKFGEASALMDGFVHIIPSSTLHKHWVALDCWCDPRVLWMEGAGTCLISHRHLKVPEHIHGS